MSNIPHENQPGHVVIIMDGNGRWAKRRGLPRIAGHKAGIDSLRKIVQQCVRREIPALTVYAFSSENWKRPENEVNLLLKLFISSLEKEIRNLHDNNVKLRFIGDCSAFPESLQNSISSAHELTRNNTGLKFNVAINYGGRWDITEAVRKIAIDIYAGKMSIDDISEETLDSRICLSELPSPDLFIRTGGEMRVSNFLLWQIAYTELYFCDSLWPDFDETEFEKALRWYAGRERRFGSISEQVNHAGRN